MSATDEPRSRDLRRRPALAFALLLLLLPPLLLASGGGTEALASRPESLVEVGAHLTESRHCPLARVPGLLDSPSEIDVLGRPAPTCKTATSVLRLAVNRLPTGRWQPVGVWRCVWVADEVECKRGAVRVFAANPGD